ncbi:hypothetical protein WN943_006563 [Citrus x changshan-huyou]
MARAFFLEPLSRPSCERTGPRPARAFLPTLLTGHYGEEQNPGGSELKIQRFVPIVAMFCDRNLSFTIYVYFTKPETTENSQQQLDYFLSFDYRSRDLCDLKNMETACEGDNSWSEGVVARFPLLSISDDGIVNEDLDFLVVPQYGRKRTRSLRLAGHYREEQNPGGTGLEIQQFAPIVVTFCARNLSFVWPFLAATIYVYFTKPETTENSQKQLDYFLSFDSRSRDLCDLKNMEATCAGDNSWLEGVVALFPPLSVSNDGIANYNLDFLVVPQYERNANHTG